MCVGVHFSRLLTSWGHLSCVIPGLMFDSCFTIYIKVFSSFKVFKKMSYLTRTHTGPARRPKLWSRPSRPVSVPTEKYPNANCFSWNKNTGCLPYMVFSNLISDFYTDWWNNSMVWAWTHVMSSSLTGCGLRITNPSAETFSLHFLT